MGTNTGWLYFSRKHERENPHPIVNLYPHSYGWQVFPATRPVPPPPGCRGLTLRDMSFAPGRAGGPPGRAGGDRVACTGGAPWPSGEPGWAWDSSR